MILATPSLQVVFQLFQTRHQMAHSFIGVTLLKILLKKVHLLKYAIYCFMDKNQIKNNLLLLILKLKIKCISIKKFSTFIKDFSMMPTLWALCAVWWERFLAFWILNRISRTQNIENHVLLNLLQRCLF